MGTKLPPAQLELYRRIDEILFYKWDPIGVSDSAEARDEYQGYLPEVFAMVMDSRQQADIACYLGKVSSQNMGLSPRPDHDLVMM